MISVKSAAVAAGLVIASFGAASAAPLTVAPRVAVEAADTGVTLARWHRHPHVVIVRRHWHPVWHRHWHPVWHRHWHHVWHRHVHRHWHHR